MNSLLCKYARSAVAKTFPFQLNNTHSLFISNTHSLFVSPNLNLNSHHLYYQPKFLTSTLEPQPQHQNPNQNQRKNPKSRRSYQTLEEETLPPVIDNRFTKWYGSMRDTPNPSFLNIIANIHKRPMWSFSMYLLNGILLFFLADGIYTDFLDSESYLYCRLLMNNQDTDAMNTLGNFSYWGLTQKQSFENSLSWYIRSVAAGNSPNPEACLSIAKMYTHGIPPLPYNPALGFLWGCIAYATEYNEYKNSPDPNHIPKSERGSLFISRLLLSLSQNNQHSQNIETILSSNSLVSSIYGTTKNDENQDYQQTEFLNIDAFTLFFSHFQEKIQSTDSSSSEYTKSLLELLLSRCFRDWEQSLIHLKQSIDSRKSTPTNNHYGADYDADDGVSSSKLKFNRDAMEDVSSSPKDDENPVKRDPDFLKRISSNRIPRDFKNLFIDERRTFFQKFFIDNRHSPPLKLSPYLFNQKEIQMEMDVSHQEHPLHSENHSETNLIEKFERDFLIPSHPDLSQTEQLYSIVDDLLVPSASGGNVRSLLIRASISLNLLDYSQSSNFASSSSFISRSLTGNDTKVIINSIESLLTVLKSIILLSGTETYLPLSSDFVRDMEFFAPGESTNVNQKSDSIPTYQSFSDDEANTKSLESHNSSSSSTSKVSNDFDRSISYWKKVAHRKRMNKNDGSTSHDYTRLLIESYEPTIQSRRRLFTLFPGIPTRRVDINASGISTRHVIYRESANLLGTLLLKLLKHPEMSPDDKNLLVSSIVKILPLKYSPNKQPPTDIHKDSQNKKQTTSDTQSNVPSTLTTTEDTINQYRTIREFALWLVAKSAALGEPNSSFLLSQLFLKGDSQLGLDADISTGIQLLKIAYDQQHPDAVTQYTEFSNTLRANTGLL